MTTSSYVGMDVSKDRLDVAVLMEATGGYQRGVVEALLQPRLGVAVVNPAE